MLRFDLLQVKESNIVKVNPIKDYKQEIEMLKSTYLSFISRFTL